VVQAGIGPDGTIYNHTGFGSVTATLTRILYGRWQHWQLAYSIGSGTWSWIVDGDGDNNLVAAQGPTNAPVRSIQIVVGPNATGIPLYFDGMPDLALLNPRVSQGTFAFDIQTVAGKYYLIQYKDDLGGGWQTNPSVLVGEGSLQTFSEPVSTESRFYQVIMQ